jgi:phosphoenolpyruvate synthase/pyruvate phosphate dikinase
VKAPSAYTHIRFRSSTNAEDLLGLNGAGLYESHTGILDDSAQSIESAIKKVWSSMWTLQGLEERAYYRIDQKSACMGILVHRALSIAPNSGSRLKPVRVATNARLFPPKSAST